MGGGAGVWGAPAGRDVHSDHQPVEEARQDAGTAGDAGYRGGN